MKIIEVYEQPIGGQFVAVWIWNNKPYSGTYRYNKRDYLERYMPDIDTWETGFDFPDTTIKYFVVDKNE